MSKRKYQNDILYVKNVRLIQSILYNLFKWVGLPDTIDERFLNRQVSQLGYITGCEHKGEIIVARGALAGIDRQDMPTDFMCANPQLPTFTRTIGKDCAVLYNTERADLKGQSDGRLLEYYAYKLYQVDLSYNVSLQNSRAALVFAVEDEAQAQRVRRLYDDINSGMPAAIAYRIGGQTPEIVPVKARDNLIVDMLADAKRSILADMFVELGINALAVDKKERVTVGENESNTQQIQIYGASRLDARRRWCDEMNRIFGTDISVDYNYEEVIAYADSGAVSDKSEDGDPEPDTQA